MASKKELELKVILDATINGDIKWHRIGKSGDWAYEAEFKSWKLILKHRVVYSEFGDDNRFAVRYDDWALTMEDEELQRSGVKCEYHYTDIWDGFNEIHSGYSSQWHYQGNRFFIHKMQMDLVDYKELEDLCAEAGWRAS